MLFPIHPEKYRERSLFSAADWLKARWAAAGRRSDPLLEQPPDRVIFTYQPALLHSLGRGRRLRKVGGFFGDTYLVKSGDRTVAVLANFGVGAPVAVVLLEQFSALGVGEFVSVGMAGGLTPGAQAGDLIVCDRALRDEGVSYHYLAPSRYAVASGPLTRQIQACLEAAGQTFRLGPVWTTDAPFRETILEVEQYRREGILAVEMEAAALFAAGQSLGVQVAAAFAVGDSLDEPAVTSPPPGWGAPAGQPAGPDPGLRWRLDFDFSRTIHGLAALIEAALRAGEAGCA